MLGLSLGIPFRPYDRSAIQQMLDALRRNNGSLWYVPDNALGDGAPNLLSSPEFANGVTDAPTRSGLITLSSMSGYDNAIAFGYDGVTGSVAYKSFTFTNGLAYTLSVIVRMDDGLPPEFSGGVTGGGCPFGLVVNGAGLIPTSVVLQADGNHRVSATYLSNRADISVGIVKYHTNNNRTFKVTGYKLEQSSVATAYTPQSVLRQRGVYVDNAGTTPVTAVGDLVGLLTDKSYGGQLGPNLVTNGDFSSGTAGWTVLGGWALSSGAMVATSASSSLLQQGAVSTAGRSYEVEFDWTHTGGTLYVRVGAGTAATFTSSGRKRVILVAASAAGVEFYGGTVSGTLDNITSKEVPGNHATQSAVASKPSLQRVPKRLGPNLVVNGTFDTDTGWTKGEGWTISGGKAVRSPSSFGSVLSQPISVTAGKSYAVTYTLADRVAGGHNVAFSGGTTVNGPPRTVNGTYSDTLLAQPGNNTLWIVTGDNMSSLSSDNIEVREVLEWTNVISFDGSNDFLQTGITTGNEGWVCAGVSSPNTNSTYFCSGAGSNSQKGIWLYRTSANNRLNFLVGDGVIVSSNGNLLTIPVNAPTVVEGGWDATTNMIAVDGVEATTPRTNGSASPSPALLRMGAYTDGVTYPLGGSVYAKVYTPVFPSAADRATIRNGIAALQGRTL